jgi:universal stress protein E
MKKLDSILVILDKPKHAQTALARAKDLAQAVQAHLHLVSFAWLGMAEEKDVFDAHQRRAMKKAVVDERKSWLRNQVLDNKLMAADVTTEVVWTDDIAGWVQDRVADGKTHLVVKSVHHSKTLMHTPLDWDLLRRCGAPLLLVSTKRRRKSGNVLATLDLRHSDRKHQVMNLRVLDAAARFAELGGGKVHCVSAVEYSVVLRDLDIIDVRRKHREAQERSAHLLEALLEPYDIPKARVHMPAGKVGQMVNGIARKIDADLMVVGTSAHRRLGEVLVGSSAEKILSRANCDVLAVHP